MIDFVSWVYEWMGYILLAFFSPLVPCTLMAFYSAFNKKPRKVVARYAFPCMGIIISIGVFVLVLNYIARVAVVNEVERIASGNDFQVYIEGSAYKNPYDIATSFEEDHLRLKMSGSSPKKAIHVSLSSSKGKMRFIFYRDSRDKDVHWVWYRGYKGSHNGHFYLKTNLLDDF